MGQNSQKISTCLWFDDQAEDAANLYVSIFPNSEILGVTHYGPGMPRPEGMVMTVNFTLDGRPFTALNGGPEFGFTEALSLMVDCASQEEVDYYWDRLSAGGDEKAQMCGWLKDRYGLSWQIIPSALGETIGGPDPAGAQRAVQAMLQMKKLDVAALKRAYEGT